MHHLSTLNILNRNQTVSSFLASLTAEEEQRVFKLSSKKAASIRKLHTEQEQQAIQRKCQHLEEVKQRKAAMEEKKRARKEAIFDKIWLHGGPCRTIEDVNRLLSRYRKKTDRVHAVRAEIHFHKYIMDRKSPLLKVAAKFPEQLANLKQFLQNLGPTAPQAEVPDTFSSTSSSTGECDCEWINYVYFDCSYSFLFKVWMWSKITTTTKILNLFCCHEKWWLGGWVCFVGGDGKNENTLMLHLILKRNIRQTHCTLFHLIWAYGYWNMTV